MLLHGGQFLIGDFHAHVAAADHDALAGGADFLNVVDAALVLDLGDQAQLLAAVGVHKGSQVDQVLLPGHEGAGHVIHVVLDAEQQVVLVLLAQVHLIQDLAGEGHALAVAQLAARHHPAPDFRPFDFHHVHGDQAVIDQYPVARVQILVQVGIGDGHLVFVALHVVHMQGEQVALVQENLVVHKGFDPVLGAFGVQHDGDGQVQLFPDGFHPADLFRVFRVGAVGKIDPGHVHARQHHFFQDFFALAGRADGANDFCFAHITSPP